jgi:L-ribulokinase
MAVLALYLRKKNENEGLPDFLERAIFAEARSTTLPPKAESRMGANAYLRAYKEGLELERAAGKFVGE